MRSIPRSRSLAVYICTKPARQAARLVFASLFATVIGVQGTSAQAEDKPQPTATETLLNLPKAMELAENYAFSARIASSSLHEARMRRNQTLAAMAPTVSLESTQAWISKDVNKAVGKSLGGNTVPDRINTAAIMVTQPIVPLGPLYMKLQADLTSIKVAEADDKQSRLNARFQGAEAFVRAQKAERFLAIAEASLRLVEKQKKDGEALFRTGRIAGVDKLRLDMALADAKAQLEQAKNTRELSLVGLAETTGIPDHTSIKLSSMTSALEVSQDSAAYARDKVLSETQTNRSEVKSAAARVEMAEYSKLASDFDYLPMINAILKYERDFEKKDVAIPAGVTHIHAPRTGAVPGPIVYSSSPVSYKKADIRDSMSFGLSIKWTLWDWGSRIARSSELGATIEKAKLGQAAVESGLRVEATQAALDFDYAKAALELAETSAKFAEEAYRQQNARFQSGAATVTDITTAERDQTRARGGLANAQGDLDLAWLKLFKVMGKEPPAKK